MILMQRCFWECCNEREKNYEAALKCYDFSVQYGHSHVSEHISRVKSIQQELQCQQGMKEMLADYPL